MAAPKQPAIRLTFRLDLVPAAAGTTVYRWASRPLADSGAWAEARVLTWGQIARELSTADGDYDIATTEVTIDDSDGLFRELLAGVQTRYFTSREAAIEILSEAGRAAELEWRTLFRGRVTAVQPKPGRRLTLRLADVIGSHFSGFDLDKQIPQATIRRREHPAAPDATAGRVYPIIVGEHSDYGVVDVNGNPADKGLLPAIDVGDVVLASDGSDVPADVVPSYLTAPINLAATVSGTVGTTPYEYVVTAISPYGETVASTTLYVTGPDLLNGTDAIAIAWDAVSGAIEYRVYGRRANTAKRLLAQLNNNETWVSPETTWTDDGAASEGATSPPATNGAQVEQVLTSGAAAFGWGRLVLALGAVDVHQIYASDLAAGTTPKRIRMPESVFGDEFLAPGHASWPHDEDYIEINGIRMTVIYARGERLTHHRDGHVTITWNGCGAEDVGDGSGAMIDEAFLALQWFLNEHILKNDGAGYRTGTYGPLATFSNSVALLKTSAYASCQATTAEWIGGLGYLAAWALTEPISLREFLRRFCVTFGCLIGTNHHGQVFPVLVDDTADPTAGRLYRDRIEIHRLTDQDIDHDAVETRVSYSYDWDTEAGRFRFPDLLIEDTFASDAHLGPRQRDARKCYYTRDRATADDSTARHLARVKVAPRTVTFETDLTGLEDENGAQIRVTHYDGAGGVNGDDETPMLVLGQTVDPNRPERVRLTCLDLGRILAAALPALADEGLMSGNLGDETSASDPTTGAYEMR